MKRALLAGLLWIVSQPAAAQIWAWTDAEGVRRFTNHEELIPDDYREQARVLVKDVASPAETAPLPAREEVTTAARARPERRLAQVVYDEPPPSEEYLRGLATGLDLGSERERRRERIDIEPVVITPPFIPPASFYPQPIYSPYVTTGFDRGRTRHRTLRMALQNEFQGERYSVPPWGVGYFNGVPYPGWTRFEPRPAPDPWHGKRYYLR